MPLSECRGTGPERYIPIKVQSQLASDSIPKSTFSELLLRNAFRLKLTAQKKRKELLSLSTMPEHKTCKRRRKFTRRLNAVIHVHLVIVFR